MHRQRRTRDDDGQRAGHPHAVVEAERRVAELPEEELLGFDLRAAVVLPAHRPKGGCVALVQQEKPAVSGHLVDEPVEECHPHAAARRGIFEPGHGVAHQLVHRLMQGHEDLVLGAEVVVEGGLGHPHPRGDLAERGLLVPLLDEEIEGDIQDPLARSGLTGRRFSSRYPRARGEAVPDRTAGRHDLFTRRPVSSALTMRLVSIAVPELGG
jgi:hypothetical protein